VPTYHPAPLESPELLTWNAIRGTDVPWRGLLIGNGASIAVSSSFGYPSLLEVAASPNIDQPLRGGARQLFDALGTTNFEFVLASLKLAGRVCAATGVDYSAFPQLYRDVQQALFEAVGHVHVPWEIVAGRSLPRIRAELVRYKSIFSTNYDLLVYWAMMSEGDPDDFRDFFWELGGGPFDPANVEIWGAPAVVYFLHGGVHLRRTTGGGTLKRAAVGGTLLSQFRTDWESAESPLLVSEGTSADKLLSISGSDYLSFAYSGFARHTGNLVIFGHGLGEQDDHLVHAMNEWNSPPWNPRQIAVSVRGQLSEQQVRQEKARLAQRLPSADLWFYEADTHPLGEPNVRPTLFGVPLA
jgi:Domain of unknown function (DUF4917)